MELRKYVRQETGVEMDMTPMIDIVFLLIIFFMVVTELTNLETPELTLPVADQAKVEEPQPGSRTIVLNVLLTDPETGEGAIRIGGGDILTEEELIRQLKVEAAVFDIYETNPTNKNQQDSLLEVIVRADRGVNAEYIHKIYQACEKAKIFKVRVGANQEAIPKD